MKQYQMGFFSWANTRKGIQWITVQAVRLLSVAISGGLNQVCENAIFMQEPMFKKVHSIFKNFNKK